MLSRTTYNIVLILIFVFGCALIYAHYNGNEYMYLNSLCAGAIFLSHIKLDDYTKDKSKLTEILPLPIALLTSCLLLFSYLSSIQNPTGHQIFLGIIIILMYVIELGMIDSFAEQNLEKKWVIPLLPKICLFLIAMGAIQISGLSWFKIILLFIAFLCAFAFAVNQIQRLRDNKVIFSLIVLIDMYLVYLSIKTVLITDDIYHVILFVALLCSFLADFYKEEAQATNSEQRSQSENTTRETLKNASANIDDLEEAIRNENLKKLKKIINSGANVNAKDKEGMFPLMLAAGNSKNTEIIKILVEAGADVNAKGELGVTPLICAAYNNKNPEIIKMLADSGANVNEKANTNLTPLMAAAHYNKNPQIVTTLINLGAEISARDDEGRTALDYAEESNNNEVVKVLRQITINNTTNTEVNYRNQAQQENITTTRRRRVIQTQNSQEDRTPTKHKGRRLDL